MHDKRIGDSYTLACGFGKPQERKLPVPVGLLTNRVEYKALLTR